MLERNRFQFSFAPRSNKFGICKNFNSFAPENFFDFNSGVRVELFQNMLAALDERDLDAEAREELRELARDSAAAKDDERLGQFFERNRIIAREITGFIKRGQ